MFLIRRTSKRLSSCRIPSRFATQKHFKLESKSITSESLEAPSEELIKKYENKLLYNSITEPLKIKFGTKKFIINQKAFKKAEKLKYTFQTIQPLPLTLKYTLDDDYRETALEENSKQAIVEEDDYIKTNFPYIANVKQLDEVEYENSQQQNQLEEIKKEIKLKKDILDNSPEDWMTHYENYEYDLTEKHEGNYIQENEGFNINFGTPDPNYPVSNEPCYGCGAHLHCQDIAVPGYIPSEIFKNAHKSGGANLQSILCQRCHFLKEYNIALQVRVTADDYPKVLQRISFQSSLAVLLVDLTDFPCSIWPGIADIIGCKTPIVVVGNKIDLLPKDDPKFLKRIREVLLNNLKLCGFASSNIKHIELISAKTGYGVENLITSLQKIWRTKGDVYIIGCTNVGKSSLFNLLIKSDYCKVQAANLIQRTTTSPWPGTTLNLLKFPITRFSGYRLFAREKRLNELKKLEAEEQKAKSEAVQKYNSPTDATLTGRIERSFSHVDLPEETADHFSIKGSPNSKGMTRLGIDENSKEFASGKWCYDTPGVVHPDQILHLLTTEELVKTLPKEIIRPESFCVKPGTTIFIAGLARLDYVNGPNSVRLTVFRSNSLPITICKLAEADLIYEELLGTELFLVPIFKGDRATKWPGLELAKNFDIIGKCPEESSYDVVLSSAGWIAINCGWDTYKFNAWTPEKRGVHIRDSVLPKAVQLRGSRIRKSVAYKKNKFI